MSENVHILLIDDDPTVNFLNRVFIEKSDLGAKTTVITFAKDALDQIGKGTLQPAIILLDLNMPKMDGWQFVEQFQKLPSDKQQSKIIILSSTINPSDKEKANQIPEIVDFISKPLTLKKVEQLREFLI
ncbi:MAG: response regulator [Ekhidna sp.]|nr:response regulator [Ekhidna sp.]